jgi:activator of HSP90 ATPase
VLGLDSMNAIVNHMVYYNNLQILDVTLMTIRQTIEFKCGAERIYAVLMSATEFASMTGAPAEISKDDGGRFSCFGGQITGRHIELRPNQRIVQAWRAGPWEEGVYSIVRFDLSESDDSTTVVLEHTGYPDGAAEHLEGGWHKMYWEPMRAHLG